jgi:hypothetical protein
MEENGGTKNVSPKAILNTPAPLDATRRGLEESSWQTEPRSQAEP